MSYWRYLVISYSNANCFELVFAVVPALLLLLYFYKRDVFPEPRKVVIRTFLYGILVTIPIIIVGIPLQRMAPYGGHPLWYGFYIAFICAAIPEELFKFLVLYRYSARTPAFNEPMDGIVYGAAASLGFATLENLMYVAMGGWHVALMRAFTAVPTHACLGAVLGYYVGQARFDPSKRGYAGRGLLWVILLHGLYDLPIFAFRGLFYRGFDSIGNLYITCLVLMWVMCLGVLGFMIVWVLRLVQELRSAQLQECVSSERLPSNA